MIYYEPKDLADFPNITEWAQKEGTLLQERPLLYLLLVVK
jgi:hypothetical protein